MLYGGGLASERLDGGAGETIFIGGASVQNFSGGAGKNIYTYLAVADSTNQSPDYIGNFNVASDVIDLHALDANPAGTFANFTFIGSAPFSSAGGEIRVIQDVVNNQTLVEADLVGDSSADLYIRLNGIVNLTASNFALTTPQYEAAISALHDRGVVPGFAAFTRSDRRRIFRRRHGRQYSVQPRGFPGGRGPYRRGSPCLVDR